MPFDLQQELPMVNSEQEIDKKLSQQSRGSKGGANAAGSSSDCGNCCAHEQGEDEFYDPEMAGLAG